MPAAEVYQVWGVVTSVFVDAEQVGVVGVVGAGGVAVLMFMVIMPDVLQPPPGLVLKQNL